MNPSPPGEWTIADVQFFFGTFSKENQFDYVPPKAKAPKKCLAHQIQDYSTLWQRERIASAERYLEAVGLPGNKEISDAIIFSYPTGHELASMVIEAKSAQVRAA